MARKFIKLIKLLLILIFNPIYSENMSPIQVGYLYHTMQIVDRILSDHEIIYWVDGGALLGLLRHKGFIPWDGDIDLEFKEEDEHKLIALQEIFLKENLFLMPTDDDHGLYRIWKTFIDFDGRLKSFFIELYPTFQKDGKIYLRYTETTGAYPQSFWYQNEVSHISKMAFGPILINVPKNPENYINRYYGSKALFKADKFPNLKNFLPANYIWPE
ncbi:MAG: LicD family protein [Simkaniaceae bacterium]|nr:LicD family protein [Simkaniaceae bacterium]